jgi:uncharacterized membrane protein (UPF0127 family)
MKVVNCSKQTTLVERLTLAQSFFSRLKGLLGTTSLPQAEGLLIQPCNSIHTFLMHYTIDVLFLDTTSTIVKVVENMTPGRVAVARNSLSVLELPAGTVAATATQCGDQLQIMYEPGIFL